MGGEGGEGGMGWEGWEGLEGWEGREGRVKDQRCVWTLGENECIKTDGMAPTKSNTETHTKKDPKKHPARPTLPSPHLCGIH